MITRNTKGAGLTARALTRRYGRSLALDSVDLSVPPGTVHGLIGPNGAGKTTVMAALLGLVHVDSGEMAYDGEPLATVSRRLPGGVAGSVEQPRFYGYLTALRNLEVLARLDGPGGLRPDEALEQVDLAAESDTKAARLSMGMRQRLAIAAALMRRPALLVLDEPTGGLDPVGADALLRLVRGLAAEGRSILVSSHDLAMVADACDAATVLVKGRVVRSDAVTALVAEAPPPTYRIRTGDDYEAWTLLDDLPGLRIEAGPGDGLLVTASPTALDAAVARLVSHGVPLRELVSERVPLRALYDVLTSEAPSSDGRAA